MNRLELVWIVPLLATIIAAVITIRRSHKSSEMLPRREAIRRKVAVRISNA